MAIVSALMDLPHTDLSGLDAVVERLVQRDEGAALVVVEVDEVLGGGGVEALAHELRLRVLERGGDVELAPNAQEHRPRGRGKTGEEMRPQRREIHAGVGD